MPQVFPELFQLDKECRQCTSLDFQEYFVELLLVNKNCGSPDLCMFCILCLNEISFLSASNNQTHSRETLNQDHFLT